MNDAKGCTHFGYELSPSPKMAKRSDPRQLVLLSFSRRRFFQNFSVFFGMSPWPVVDVTKMTRDERRTSAYSVELVSLWG